MMAKLIIPFVVVVVLLSQSIFIIGEWEQGLVLQFGKPVRTVRTPGPYFKYPFVQDLTRFEKRILAADARPAEYITLDKKRLIVDTVSRWKIERPLVFYQTVLNYQGAIARLNDTIVARLREEIANHEFKDFIREERENIMEKVTQTTAEHAKGFGIDVVDVRIKRVDLPEEVQNSVFERMKAERKRIANKYRAEGEEKGVEIRAQADKEKEIISAEAYQQAQALRGEGDAEATAIYAEAYAKNPEFYSFMKHMEVYEKIVGTGTTLVLRRDSPLLRFLDSPSGLPRVPAAEPR